MLHKIRRLLMIFLSVFLVLAAGPGACSSAKPPVERDVEGEVSPSPNSDPSSKSDELPSAGDSGPQIPKYAETNKPAKDGKSSKGIVLPKSNLPPRQPSGARQKLNNAWDHATSKMDEAKEAVKLGLAQLVYKFSQLVN